jgi:nitric oxide reductase subunit C
MIKVFTLLILLVSFTVYSFIIYTKGTESNIILNEEELGLVKEGKQIYQQYNCMSCHQIYGLGGYLGPELTTAFSDRHRGEDYMRAFLKSGGRRMPDYKFKPGQIDALISYLKYVDSTATPIKQ